MQGVNSFDLTSQNTTFLNVLVPIYSLILLTFFFKRMEIWVPQIQSYLEGFMCEVAKTV